MTRRVARELPVSSGRFWPGAGGRPGSRKRPLRCRTHTTRAEEAGHAGCAYGFTCWARTNPADVTLTPTIARSLTRITASDVRLADPLNDAPGTRPGPRLGGARGLEPGPARRRHLPCHRPSGFPARDAGRRAGRNGLGGALPASAPAPVPATRRAGSRSLRRHAAASTALRPGPGRRGRWRSPAATPTAMPASCTRDSRKPACTSVRPSASRSTGIAGGSLPTCSAATTPARSRAAPARRDARVRPASVAEPARLRPGARSRHLQHARAPRVCKRWVIERPRRGMREVVRLASADPGPPHDAGLKRSPEALQLRIFPRGIVGPGPSFCDTLPRESPSVSCAPSAW